MTNSKELKIEMLRHDDNGGKLALALGITPPTLSNKINNISEFTQEEIYIIKNRYSLTCERVSEIFFDFKVS